VYGRADHRSESFRPRRLPQVAAQHVVQAYRAIPDGDQREVGKLSDQPSTANGQSRLRTRCLRGKAPNSRNRSATRSAASSGDRPSSTSCRIVPLTRQTRIAQWPVTCARRAVRVKPGTPRAINDRPAHLVVRAGHESSMEQTNSPTGSATHPMRVKSAWMWTRSVEVDAPDTAAVRAARRPPDVALLGHRDEGPERAPIHPDSIPMRCRVGGNGLGHPGSRRHRIGSRRQRRSDSP
jgi:hypothetical protein